MSDTVDASASTRATKAFSSATFHRKQLRHFLLLDVLPAIGTIAAIIFAFRRPPTTTDLALFAIFWLATGLGLTVGFHRYFSHRAFATTRFVALALLVMGSMAGRGPMLSWVIMHRRHHECADHEGDLHSPLSPKTGWRGLIHAHLTWLVRHDYPNVTHYAPDLLRDKTVQRWNRSYYTWVLVGLLAPTVLGGLLSWSLTGALTGFLWGGVVRLCVVAHTMSTINSLCHSFGHRAHARRDNSRNLGWLALLSWGESHHNNHHASPNSASFGRRWSEPDPGFWLIRSLQAFGLAWEVRLPK
jgi:stearoyl-CoA desaturase (delta-9 desaturase)